MAEQINVFDGLVPSIRNKSDVILLKRAVGRKFSDVSPETMAAFYSHVFCPEWAEEKMFYLACLYCEQGKNGSVELPVAWGRYNAKHDMASARISRLARLVDRPWDDNVALSLVKIVRLLIRDGYSIDFEKLATDVKFWNSDRMKRDWARKMSRIKEDN